MHWYFQTFWAVADQKMVQSGSKIKKCELILNINVSKVFFLLRIQGKQAILPKISVNVPYFSQISSG
jgi:hypothetical protein